MVVAGEHEAAGAVVVALLAALPPLPPPREVAEVGGDVLGGLGERSDCGRLDDGADAGAEAVTEAGRWFCRKNVPVGVERIGT